MTFNSLIFIFIFLPVFTLLYYLIPNTIIRNILLILGSIVFYCWTSPEYIVLLLISVLFNYASGCEIELLFRDGRNGLAKIALITTIAVDVGILCFYKYFSNDLPLGISFYTFSVISYVADIYLERSEAEFNPITAATYILFFPKVVSGPIIQFKDMQQVIRERTIDRNNLLAGLHLFIIGLFKKVLVADILGAAHSSIYALDQMSGATAWLGMIYYSLQLYFDFSGYSDMAIGLAKIYGFKFDKNFDYPYTSASMSEFWRRWHISLGGWFRDYVYIPLGGNRCSSIKQFRNLAVVWLLTGIWHGSTLNYIFWGIYHGFFVIIEKFLIGDFIKKIPKPVMMVITSLIAFVGWIFFFNPTLGSSFGYIGKMFCADGIGFFDSVFVFYLLNYLVVLIVALLLSSGIVNKLHSKFAYSKNDTFTIVSTAAHIILLLLCIAAMVAATNTTFLYFKF